MPIKPVFDLHTHTMASGHAYSTLLENLTEAKHKGLLAMGTSDHSPGMIHTTHKAFFENYKILPRTFEDVRLLRGMEANIIDYEGAVDGGLVMKDLDYVIASLHTPCIKSGSVEDNTRAIIGAMKNPWVKIIGHPDDARYPIDIEKVVQAAVHYGVALELNNSSLRPNCTRKNGIVLERLLAGTIMKYRAKAVMGSDAHVWCDIGNFTECIAMLEDMHFPEELLLNQSVDGLDVLLEKRHIEDTVSLF